MHMARHRLFLSSTHADRYLIGPTRTDALEFDLNPGISTVAGERMLVRLHSAAIPMGRYQIHSSCNKVLLTGDSGDTTLTLPQRFYFSAADLASALNASTAFTTLGVTATYTPNTNRLTLAHSNAYTITFQGAAAGSNMNTILGLPQIDYVLPANTSTQLPGQADLGGARAIIVAVEDFELDTMDSLSSNASPSSTNLLASIPVGVPLGGNLAYTEQTSQMMVAHRRSVSSVRVELLDENLKPFELLGLPWSCVIEIDIV
jgi:hypothetical protein